VLHFSGADFRCGLRPHEPERFARTADRLLQSFARMSLTQAVREIDKEFPGRDYTLRDLFLDERREMAARLLQGTMARYEGEYVNVYEHNRRLIEFLREIDSPVPRPLQVAADVALTHQAVEAARDLAADPPAAQAELLRISATAQSLGARIDLAAVGRPFHSAVKTSFERTLAGSRDAAFQTSELIAVAVRIGLHLDLWAMQNALWDHVRSGAWQHDRASLEALAHALWFDPPVLARRVDARQQRAAG
jgi:hypothetical protein